LYSVVWQRPLCEDSNKIPEGGTSNYNLHLSGLLHGHGNNHGLQLAGSSIKINRVKYFFFLFHCGAQILYRVAGFLSSRSNWALPHTLTRKGVLFPLPLWVHSHVGEGVGGPNSDEGTGTLVFYVYYCIIPLRFKSYVW